MICGGVAKELLRIRKSFLVLFFKKELLACFLSLKRQEVG
jgi:hypothetical protein